VVYTALNQYIADLAELGLECQPAKSEAYVQEGHDSDLRPQEIPLGGVTIDGDFHPRAASKWAAARSVRRRTYGAS